MKAILVFIDGTICDTRPRHHLLGTPDFHQREEMLRDAPVPGSVACLRELAQKYEIVYLGARPPWTKGWTEEWLAGAGFPPGPVYLAPAQEERLALVRDLQRRFEFAAGIGDRWDDNELHLEIGCLSIILEEFAGNWDVVRQRLLGAGEMASPPARVRVRARLAGHDDLPWCAATDALLSEAVVKRKIDLQELVVAEAAGQLAGYLRLEYLWSKIPYIGLVFVRPEYRRRGIGRAMLTFVEEFLRARGHKLLLSSSQVNEATSQAWHRAMGFLECGVLTGINERDVGEIFFRRQIS